VADLKFVRFAFGRMTDRMMMMMMMMPIRFVEAQAVF